MEKKFVRYSFVVRYVSGMVLAFAFSHAVSQFFCLQVPVYFLLAAAAGAEAAALGIDICKKKPALWISLAVCILALLLLPVVFGVRIQEFLSQASRWIRGCFTWLEQYQASLASEMPAEPEFWRSLFLSALSVAAAVLVFYPMTKYYPSRLVLAGLLLAGLIALAVTGYDINRLSLVCVLIYLVSTAMELCNRQLDRRRTEKKPFSALFLYPLCLLLAICTVILPSKAEPIQWTAVRRLLDGISVSLDAVGDRFRILFGQVPADFTIGFDDIALSGDKTTLDARTDTIILRVQTNVTARSSTYLRGSVKSDYTGTGWLDRSADYLEKDAEVEAYEVMYSLRREGLETDADEDLYHRLTMQIEYGDLITKSMLYSPLFMAAEYEAKSGFDFSGANIRFRRFQRDGWAYELTFFETNWGSENLQAHLRALDGFDYDDDETDFNALENSAYSAYHELGGSFVGIDREIYNENISSYLAQRADVIDMLYLQLPDTLPERVKSLSAQICTGCETEYDEILAVESYFRDSDFRYTLAPNPMPEGRDFVDWLLFDEQQGYCTYYASAATVLLRCAGIPARYVEGVRVDSGIGSRDLYEADGSQAHAWCEAYLEGYGWIVVDATPGFGTGREQEWPRKQLNFNTSPVEEVPPVTDPEEPIPTEDVRQEDVPDPAELARLEAQRRQMRRRLWIILSAALGALLLVGAGVGFASYKNAKRKRYRRASDSEKVIFLMHDILLYAGAVGLRRDENETVLELVERAGERCDLYEMTLRQAAMLYLKVRYSAAEATHMEVLSLFRYRRALRRSVLRTGSLSARLRFQLQETI